MNRCTLCGHALPDTPQLSLASVTAPIDPATKARRGDRSSAKSAARLAVVRAGSQRWRLLEAIAAAGDGGLTAEAASERTGLRYVSASTRVSELERGGFIARTGHTRPTSTGVQADVVVATERGRDALRQDVAA